MEDKSLTASFQTVEADPRVRGHVVHSKWAHSILDDAPEIKVSTTGMGPMRITPTVRISLLTLRGYLLLMTMLLLYHVLDLAGMFQHVK